LGEEGKRIQRILADVDNDIPAKPNRPSPRKAVPELYFKRSQIALLSF